MRRPPKLYEQPAFGSVWETRHGRRYLALAPYAKARPGVPTIIATYWLFLELQEPHSVLALLWGNAHQPWFCIEESPEGTARATATASINGRPIEVAINEEGEMTLGETPLGLFEITASVDL